MFLKKNIEEQYTKMDFLAEFEEFIDSQVEAKVTIEQFFDAFENTITKSQQAIFADVINAQDSSKAWSKSVKFWWKGRRAILTQIL